MSFDLPLPELGLTPEEAEATGAGEEPELDEPRLLEPPLPPPALALEECEEDPPPEEP